jgi:hypothetical protein
MKVFISWSGERSRLVAEALRYWLPKVIQAIQPWMSANDIEKGARWRTDIANELEQSSVGIICLTPDNLTSPWLHFEAGALSKQQQNTFVCTFLHELEPSDVREPLSQFQTTKAQKDDVRKLIHTINNTLEDRKLPEIEINETFDVWWTRLEERLGNIPHDKNVPRQHRSEREILEELLELVRAQVRTKSPFISFEPDRYSPVVKGSSLPKSEVMFLAKYLNLRQSEVMDKYFDADKLFEFLQDYRVRLKTGNEATHFDAETSRTILRRVPLPTNEADENPNS